MSELQAGMLALVIGTTGNMPETVGMVIEVEGVFFGRALWTYKDAGVGTMIEHLLPLPPLADPLDVTHKEELHA